MVRYFDFEPILEPNSHTVILRGSQSDVPTREPIELADWTAVATKVFGPNPFTNRTHFRCPYTNENFIVDCPGSGLWTPRAGENDFVDEEALSDFRYWDGRIVFFCHTDHDDPQLRQIATLLNARIEFYQPIII